MDGDPKQGAELRALLPRVQVTFITIVINETFIILVMIVNI